MKTKALVVGLGLSALGLASCSSSSAASSASLPNVSNTKNSGAPNTGASNTKNSGTAVTPSSNGGSGGFNSSHTALVLPHGLGDLPAPELALAKADPAYASGLADPAKWIKVATMQRAGSSNTFWMYVGSYSGTQSSLIVSAKMQQATLGTTSALLSKASVSINSSAVNTFSNAPHSGSISIPNGDSLVIATPLEVEAAPVGNHAFGATSLPAFCTPIPYAWINSANKPVTITGMPSAPAGPSAVFAVSSTTQTSVSYSQGVSSCQGFN